jgi:hypothetical protein
MRRRGPTPKAWLEIRTAYESGKESISAVARRFKTTRETIKRHARAQGWIVDANQAANQVLQNKAASPQEIARATRAKVVDIATRRGLESQSPALVKEVAATLEDLLERQLPLAAKTLDFAEKMMGFGGTLLKRAEENATEPPPREGWSGFANNLVATSARAVELIREVAGLKAGQPSVVIAKKTFARRFVVTTPEKIVPQDPPHEEAG